ncbi:MAG TPA: hypothetical protein VFV68_00055, partial [Agriterribacter sp.]|nr:hypothetical protein [Agriterribacter sp.]
KSNQVQIQIKSSEAWFAFRDGRRSEALELMNTAADMQDKTEKHPVTPGEVVPARELLGDMLLQMDKPREALEAYAADLEKHPNRFNGLYGAALAAETSGNVEMANMYYRQLLNIANRAQQERTELMLAKRFLKSHKHL